MSKLQNTINWFEIPVSNLERARKFYGTILEAEIKPVEVPGNMPSVKMAFLPGNYQEGVLTGSLMEGDGYVPSDQGALIYLNGGSDLSIVLNRVECAGGKVVQTKTAVGEHGHIAKFKDSEGNLVALHSMM